MYRHTRPSEPLAVRELEASIATEASEERGTVVSNRLPQWAVLVHTHEALYDAYETGLATLAAIESGEARDAATALRETLVETCIALRRLPS